MDGEKVAVIGRIEAREQRELEIHGAVERDTASRLSAVVSSGRGELEDKGCCLRKVRLCVRIVPGP